jgi:serine phosphatase RsbU (regulator of sigma subunit)
MISLLQAEAAPCDSTGMLETEITRWNSPAGNARAGGDWCDALHVSADVLALTVGDVSGHGEAASGTMHYLRSAIVKAIREGRNPSQALCIANDLAYARSGGVIVTAIVGVLDRRKRTFSYANAGHPPPILLFEREHRFLKQACADFPLGIFPHHHCADHIERVADDALLVLYTDGITEHARDLLLGELELAESSRLAYDEPKSETARNIAERVLRELRGDDDAAVLTVRTRIDDSHDSRPGAGMLR